MINNEKVTASISQVINTDDKKQSVNKEIKKYTEDEFLEDKSPKSNELYYNLKERIFSDFSDIEIGITKLYTGFNE